MSELCFGFRASLEISQVPYGKTSEIATFYIGEKGEAKMPTEIKHENLDFKFHLINIAEISYKKFIDSDQPEDLLIAILCDFEGESPSAIISTILKRLQALAADELCLGKYLKQLEVLSKLRNLQEETIKNINTMAITYDIRTDLRYLQGKEESKEEWMEKGKEESKDEWMEKGKEEEKNVMISEMINTTPSMPLEQIAKIARVSIDYVRQIYNKIKTKNH